jgi:hypothetical protein
MIAAAFTNLTRDHLVSADMDDHFARSECRPATRRA